MTDKKPSEEAMRLAEMWAMPNTRQVLAIDAALERERAEAQRIAAQRDLAIKTRVAAEAEVGRLKDILQVALEAAEKERDEARAALEDVMQRLPFCEIRAEARKAGWEACREAAFKQGWITYEGACALVYQEPEPTA